MDEGKRNRYLVVCEVIITTGRRALLRCLLIAGLPEVGTRGDDD